MAKMPTKRTCHVTEAIIAIIATISMMGAIMYENPSGISKSNTLKSDEACSNRISQYKYVSFGHYV